MASATAETRADEALDKVKQGVSELIPRLQAVDAAALGLDNDALERFDKVILELSRIRGVKEGKPQSLEVIELPQRLLDRGAKKFKEFSASWPEDVFAGIVSAGGYFDDLLASRDAIASFKKHARAIIENLGKVAKSANSDAADQAVTLAANLAENLPVPSARQADLAGGMLTKLIDDADKRAELLSDAKTVEMLASLRVKLALFARQAQPRIHVVAAFYGDLHAIDDALKTRRSLRTARQNRWCVASAALLPSCERSTACKPAALSFPKDLCGYDPAPLMSREYKGLLVFYRCLSNLDDSLWDNLAREANLTPSHSVLDRSRSTVLQTNQQGFFCAAEAAP